MLVVLFPLRWLPWLGGIPGVLDALLAPLVCDKSGARPELSHARLNAPSPGCPRNSPPKHPPPCAGWQGKRCVPGSFQFGYHCEWLHKSLFSLMTKQNDRNDNKQTGRTKEHCCWVRCQLWRSLFCSMDVFLDPFWFRLMAVYFPKTCMGCTLDWGIAVSHCSIGIKRFSLYWKILDCCTWDNDRLKGKTNRMHIGYIGLKRSEAYNLLQVV